MTARPVVVGVDDSAESDWAIDWAAREALARRVPLRIVRAYDWPPSPSWASWSSLSDASITAALRSTSNRIARRALRLARERVPGVDADELVVAGRAADVLLAASRRAGVLVVGARHVNLVQRMTVGDVSVPVADRSRCPVVVVRAPDEPVADPGVVAGVSGHPGDADVLTFAFDHAERHHLPLRAVLCAHHDDRVELASLEHPVEATPEDAALAEALAGWCERHPDVPVHLSVVRQPATAALVAAGSGQALLVLGQPHRRFACAAATGSVAHGVLRNATCPVAVVPTG